MKFITEQDLRSRYRADPFTSYTPEPGTRLTPGARQFLTDRGIRLEADGPKKPAAHPADPIEKPAAQSAENSDAPKADWQLDLKELQAEFLQAGLDLMERDVLAAGQVFDLERRLARLAGEEPVEQAEWLALCPRCTGIGPENCGQWMEDCFEVTGFHAQMPGGKTLVRLHLLRCGLRRLEAHLPEEKKLPAHCIINRLSQMICHSFGGTVCQKK